MKIQTAQFGEVHVLTECPLLDSTERLEFLTEVHESYNGTEQRLNLRDRPRQILSFNYVNMRKAMGDMFHMLYANLRKTWGISLKQIKQALPDADNSDFIPFDTVPSIADLRVGYALVETATTKTVVQITEIGRYVVTQQEIIDPETQEIIQPEIIEYQDGLRLAAPITVANATITPIRICIIDGDVNIAASGFYAGQQIMFRVLAEDLPEVEGEIPTQYKNEDLYFKPLLLEGDSIEMTLNQHQVIVDGDVGGFTQFTHWAKPRYMKPFKSLLKSQAEYHQYRNFLFRRMGRYKAFWMPLYERHINVTNSGTIYNVLNTDTAYVLEADRKHLAIKINGVWSAYEITAKTVNTLTVSPALNVLASSIEAVCYLGLYRLAADAVEFSFLGANMSQVNVPIVELSA